MPILQIETEPYLAVMDAPPLLPPTERHIQKVRAQLAFSEHLFDGPVLLTRTATPEIIEAYEASYAWQLAHSTGAAFVSKGLLGVSAILHDDAGSFLWQRRGQATKAPGQWTVSASGAVDVKESFRQAAERELLEETGIAAEAVRDLQPAALFVSHLQSGVGVVYTGIVDRDIELTPCDAQEIADLAWAPAPKALDGDVSEDCAAIWQWLRARRCV